MSKTIWLWWNSVSITVGYYDAWDLSHLPFATISHNNWAWGFPCLDINMRIWRLGGSITFWDLPNHKTKNKHPFSEY